MSHRKKKIKIAVVGDDEVGKTSFIASLITDTALRRVEKIIGPVVLPPDMFNWQYDCTTVLIDTSSDLQDIDLVENEIKAADVVLLMYDISQLSTAQRLGIYWMPRIQRVSPKIPVVVVGNKSDLLEDEKLDEEIEFQRIIKVIKPLIRHYNQVEMGMECSVTQGKCIPDIIHCAQRAFLFPLAPLYNLNAKQITPQFKKALTHIFRLCDRDQDGRWNDKELMGFQQRVFKRDLDQGDIAGIKEMIKEELQNNSNEHGITLEGFLALQKRGVELIKIQTCWTILRHFKYQDDLELEAGLFNNQLLVDKESGQSVELSQKSVEFLRNIYRQFQRAEPLLPVAKVEDILFPCPHPLWKDLTRIVKTKRINSEDYIDLDHWIALWQQVTYMDYMEAYKALKYVGYSGNLNDSFLIQHKKSSYSEYSKISQRNVFHVLMVVPSKSSMSRLLETLIEVQSQKSDQSEHPIVEIITVQQKPRVIIVSLCAESELQQNPQDIDFVVFQRNQQIRYLSCPAMCMSRAISQASSFQSFSSEDFSMEDLKSHVQQMIEKPFKFMHPDLVNELKSQDSVFYRFGAPIFVGLGIVGCATLLWNKRKHKR